MHLGPFTFRIPFNYLSADAERATESAFSEGVRYSDARSGPIKFFLWDFSGLTPRRAAHVGGKSDEFVFYNFGVYPTPSPQAIFARSPGLYAAAPDFQEAGLRGYLPQVAGAETMSKDERRQKHLLLWVGKSSHGGDIVLECSMSSRTCAGYGKHPVGGYDYQFSFDIAHFARWKDIEAGVHAKLMSWLAPVPPT